MDHRMDQRMAAVDPVVDPAPARRIHRLVAVSVLLGVLLLLVSGFFPVIIRVIYQSRAGCPTGPECPPPDILADSYGEDWISWIRSVFGAGQVSLDVAITQFLFGPAPFLALIIVQAAIAWRAWSGSLLRPARNEDVVANVATMIIFGGRPRRVLLKGGVAASVVATILFLGSSWFIYCFFFCGSGTPLPGEYKESTGPWQSSGVRYLAPGFWLMLSGLLLSVGSDVLLLVSARRNAYPSV
jgi:hypothetical protein